jgi:hypothetical protein
MTALYQVQIAGWAHGKGVETDFRGRSRPAGDAENESVNGRCCEERLK